MNESVRKPKMELANKINKARSEYFFNCLLYGVALLPIVFFSKRFFVSRGGLPYTNAYTFLYEVQTTLTKSEQTNKPSTSLSTRLFQPPT